MFNLLHKQPKAYQTSITDLSRLLGAQRQGGQDIMRNLTEYGQAGRGDKILEEIAGMTPEQRKEADFLGMAKGGQQSKQTMDILKGMASQRESEKTREGQLALADKRLSGGKALARYKKGLEGGADVSQEEQQKTINLFSELTKQRNKLTAGMAHKNATRANKAEAARNVALIDAEIDKISPIVFPHSKRAATAAPLAGQEFLSAQQKRQLYKK